MKKPIFNGHTWIVAIIAILILGAIGIFGEHILFKLLTTDPNNEYKNLEILGIPTIPIIVVKGILSIVERLTFIPKTKGATYEL